MIPKGSAAIVMSTEMQLTPNMLGYVVEKGRREITNDQNGEYRGEERDDRRPQHDRVHVYPYVKEANGGLFSSGRNPLRAGLLSLSFLFNPAQVQIDALRDAALSWHIPAAVGTIRGLRLFVDAPRGGGEVTAVVRSIVRANHRIAPLDALDLAYVSRDAARREGIDEYFVASTLLQESAFNPTVISSAGAIGIGQFTFGTAEMYGIDPFNPREAIGGTAHLLALYLKRYAASGGDAYTLALAAYNAGPGAVAKYHGVPPYPETREYITDIYYRWGRLLLER